MARPLDIRLLSRVSSRTPVRLISRLSMEILLLSDIASFGSQLTFFSQKRRKLRLMFITAPLRPKFCSKFSTPSCPPPSLPVEFITPRI